MTDGIRATVEFAAAPPCPIAEVSDSMDVLVDEVWASVPAGDATPMTEFVLEAESVPSVPAARHVLSAGHRHLFRLAHDHGEGCPCERIGAIGCAVQRYVARSGTLRLVFNAASFEELQSVIGSLRVGYPELDVRRLVRTPSEGASSERVTVDRGRLTDRQLEVLATAYRMGYFERPRRANAAEVAAELDIAASTFAEHLSVAESKLLSDILDDVPGGVSPRRGT